MKHINLIIAFLMGASFALAAPTIGKGPMQGLTGSLGATAPMFHETLNVSAPAPGFEPTSIPVPGDGALVKTHGDPSSIKCDIWVDDDGNPNPLMRTQPDMVRWHMDKLRARSDKPKTLADGDCQRPICEDNSGIIWCVNVTESHSYTLESWDVLADTAQAIMDTCSPKTDNGWFNGQAFYSDGWLGAVSYCT